MKLSEQQIRGLGVALNEATLLGIEANPGMQIVGATFAVLALPENGPPAQDSRVQLVFNSVGRIAASLRLGRWDDRAAKIEGFSVEQLLQVSQNFCCPIYGWEFFNLDSRAFHWLDRLGLDWHAGGDCPLNSFSFFQDGGSRHLDVCIWFGSLIIRDAGGKEIALDDFIAGGKRWWDGLHAGDPRVQASGIAPLK